MADKPTLTPQHRDIIEAMIDRTHVATLLETISQVCYAKAEHIQHDWQDAELADLWREVGYRILKLSTKLEGFVL
jgi:hypothetical protein